MDGHGAGAQELYDTYRQIGLRLEDFEGPRYMRIDHIRELLASGKLDANLRLANARPCRSNKEMDGAIRQNRMTRSAQSEMTGMKSGESIYRLMEELYPICRSITGDGLRQTLRRIQEDIPLQNSRSRQRHSCIRLDCPSGMEYSRRLH